MKKTFKLQDLDCANCAAKIENAINKIDGVNECKVNFIGQKLLLDANDEKFDRILELVKKSIKKIEPDVVILN